MQFTKTQIIWLVILGGFAIAFKLYQVFDLMKDWSHHRLYILWHFVIILGVAYSIYIIIKKYKSSSRQDH